MPPSDDALHVGGGRRAGYRLSGADTSPTLLYFHGSPSSRAEVGDYEPGLLEERGIGAVAVDRPGYGATDPLDDLDLLARTQDAIAVAGHLGMTRFAVQGTSGGGPYALACAVLMPNQVQAVILTSAGGGISQEGGLDGLRTMTSTFPADEREWVERNSEALARDMAEAMRQGAPGWWLDGQAFGEPWPFDIAEIRAPVHIFHGDSDSLAPLPVLRRSLARAARVTEERLYPGGNHFAPWATRERQAAMLAVIPADDAPLPNPHLSKAVGECRALYIALHR